MLPGLKSVCLIGTSIGENLDYYVDCLKKPGIEQLDLQYNGITANTIKACFKHIVNFDTLTSINFTQNWFGIDGLFEIKDEFLRFKRLRSLKLGQNKLSWGDQQNWMAQANKFAEFMQNVSYLEELDIKDNSIKDLHFKEIVPKLVAMKNLKYLSLEKNQISNIGLLAYLQALANHYSNG